MAAPGPADHLDALREQGATLADALGRADPRTPVPSCPGWDVARLGRHIGWIYDKVRRVVDERLEALPTTGAEPPPDEDIASWVRGLHGRLVEVLGRHDPAAPCWTWAGERRVAFWLRRMAAETAVHRFDLDHALAGAHGAPPVPAPIAADALDELLVVLLPALHPQGSLPGSLALRCTDVDGAWTLHGAHGRTVAERGTGPADALVVGPASNVLLVTIGRLPPSVVEVTGDAGVLDAWLAAPRF